MDQPPDEIAIPILEIVSDALETSVKELPPLSNSIDLDGLNMVVTNDPSHDVTITFYYAGLRVLVHSRSTIYVRPIRDEKGGMRREIQEEEKIDSDSDSE